jgi:hypothetical protein
LEIDRSSVLLARKHKHLDGFHDGVRHSRNGRRFLERALTHQKLGVGNERESGIRAQLRTLGELLKAAARYLSNGSMLM